MAVGVVYFFEIIDVENHQAEILDKERLAPLGIFFEIDYFVDKFFRLFFKPVAII